jgi:DNA-binding NarL/FixJ family response regulator
VRSSVDRQALLTVREQQILEFIAAGYSAKQVAQRIEIAPRTVERHIENIRQKMHARNTPHMISRAYTSGMLAIAAS